MGSRKDVVLQAFFRNLQTAVAGVLPQGWELSPDAGGTVVVHFGDQTIGFELERYYRLYRCAESRGEDGLRRVIYDILSVIRMVQASPRIPGAEHLARVYPQFCTREPSEPDSDGTFVRPWIAPLNLQYGLAAMGRLAILAGWTLTTMETNAESLHRRAVKNLAAVRPRWRRVAPGVVGLMGGPRPRLNATQMVLPDRMHAAATLLGTNTMHVAAPTNSLLLACGATDEAVAALEVAARILARCGGHSLTRGVLRWENGLWQGWVPGREGQAYRQSARVQDVGASRRVALQPYGVGLSPGAVDAQLVTADPDPEVAAAAQTRLALRRKVKRAEVYAGFLREEGLLPTVDEDGFTFVKFEGELYILELDDCDETFVRIVETECWSVNSEEERRRALVTALQTTRDVKAAKVYIVKNAVWVSVEAFYASPESIKPVLLRSLYAVQATTNRFRNAMTSDEQGMLARVH